MRGPGFLWSHRLPPASTPVFVSRGWARKRWSADPRLPIWAEAVPVCARLPWDAGRAQSFSNEVEGLKSLLQILG